MKPTRYRRINRKLTLINVGANFCGAILTSLYFALLSLQLESVAGWVWGLWGAIPVLMMVSGGVTRERSLASLNRWYRRALQEEHAEPPPPAIQKLALNRPGISASVTLFVWLVGGLLASVVVGVGTHADHFNWPAFLQTSLGSVVVGPITAALLYFVLERVWRSELPLFFPKGSPSEVVAFRLTVRRRLLVLFGTSTLPLLFLAVTTYTYAVQMIRAPRPAALLPNLLRLEIFTVSVGLFVTLVLAGTLGVSLVESLQALNRHMDAVRKGNLDQQMTVTSNDEFGRLAEGFNAMVEGLQREEIIHRLFNLYVTPEVAEYALQHGAERGGQLIEATVIFTDIRGFTALTERMEPEALIALLNRYFEAMSAVVVQHGGLVNKFGGDSLLAVFGTPLNPLRDHALEAVRTAKDLLVVLDAFNEAQAAHAEPTLRIGVGVATGSMIAGNVGGEERLEYTVIGDAVNVASRLESMTKQVDATILLNAAAARRVRERLPLQSMGRVKVRGKEAPQPIYTLAMHLAAAA